VSNGNGRDKSREQLAPAFRGEASADPDQEGEGGPTGLVVAITEAAQAAAQWLADNDKSDMNFEVTRIEVTVAPNPGPTAYKVTIGPHG
jgi:hypothetical protein